jgi:WD40 repeat protein
MVWSYAIGYVIEPVVRTPQRPYAGVGVVRQHSRTLGSMNWDNMIDTRGHTDGVKVVAFSHNSKLLASASFDNTVGIWDPATGTTV